MAAHGNKSELSRNGFSACMIMSMQVKTIESFNKKSDLSFTDIAMFKRVYTPYALAGLRKTCTEVLTTGRIAGKPMLEC